MAKTEETELTPEQEAEEAAAKKAELQRRQNELASELAVIGERLAYHNPPEDNPLRAEQEALGEELGEVNKELNEILDAEAEAAAEANPKPEPKTARGAKTVEAKGEAKTEAKGQSHRAES